MSVRFLRERLIDRAGSRGAQYRPPAGDPRPGGRHAVGRAALLLLSLAILCVPARAGVPAARYRSPFDVVASPDGRTAFVSDRTAGSVVVIDLVTRQAVKEIALRGQPTGLCIAPGGERVYAAEYDAGTVAEIDTATLEVARRLPVGLRPVGVALAPRRGRLLAANTVSDDLSIVDLSAAREVTRIKLPREPFFVAVAPDEALAVVGNLLPATAASDPQSSAAVSLIDLEANRPAADLRLPAGSTSVREVCIAPSGRFAYLAHTIGRFNVPATQLDRGWVYTNAVSIIDLGGRQLHATVLLDTILEGAANPWGAQLSPDGNRLWVSLRGTHQVASLDLAKLHRLLAGDVPEDLAAPGPDGPIAASLWQDLKKDPSQRGRLADDLAALTAAGVLERHAVHGRGPRGLSLSPDGTTLLAACYFSGELVLLDASNGRLRGKVAVGPQPEPDPARRGEMLFHDGTRFFQRWASCSSCHPDEGRTDGLVWDLVNDGLGTPQNTRSLLWAHRTRPTTARGVRPGIESSVPAGFYFLNVTPDPEEVAAVTAYLSGLAPEPSPWLAPGGRLTEKAARGQALFEGKAGCANCHHGPLKSDLKLHDIGQGDLDRPGERFVTARLVELYRTAPFLHDGRAADLREIFTRWNSKRRHGQWHELTPEEREDLLEYLRSI